MTIPLSHLGLTAWPFTVVPRPAHCTFLAGRPQLRDDIRDLLHALARRDTSSIHVFWSWFGAGKTHSLFYLANEAKRSSKPAGTVALMPVYTEFPKGTRSFVELYRSFVASLDTELVVDGFLELCTSPRETAFDTELLLSCPDLAAALRILAMGTAPEKATAIRWLRGDSLPAAEFRKVGIAQKISSTEEASRLVPAIVNILGDAARMRGQLGLRVIWLLDEFQRLSKTGSRTVSDVNAGLHSVFNACPTDLTLVISFSGAPDPKRLPRCFSPELRDRIGSTKVMILPPLQPDGAVAFVREVLGHFRGPRGPADSDFHPFTKETCRLIIKQVSKECELRPRVLMQVFNAVLEAADPKLESGEIAVVTPEFARAVLAEQVFVADTDQEE